MTIDKVGSVDPIQPGKQTERARPVKGSQKADSISISSAAQAKAEVYRVKEMAMIEPESRLARIAELKAKINDPSYINDKVLNATAENIIDALFG